MAGDASRRRYAQGVDHPDLRRLVGDDRRVRGLWFVPVLVGLLVAVGLAALWPREDIPLGLVDLGVTDQVHRATVEEVADGSCSYASDLECRRVTFRLKEGPRPGSIAVQEFQDLPTTPDLSEGDSVVLAYIPDAPATLQYQYADRERRGLLVAIAVVFAVAVVALGRMRGLAALGGLAASIVLLIWFVVPAILSGRNPVLVAAVGAAAIGFLALYLAHGFGDRTHVAVLGTFAALALTVGLSAVAIELAAFSGFSGEESFYLTLAGDIDVRGLILAGIVLGALGALDDITVTQASAVWEIRAANPDLGVRALASAGFRIGRDHIASTVNTLLLAYAGAAMPLLLLFALSRQSWDVVANSEVVAVEIVRTLVGSIGLVAAVPATTWLAALVAHSRPPRENHGET
jgi:uncharacterized membrane protein